MIAYTLFTIPANSRKPECFSIISKMNGRFTFISLYSYQIMEHVFAGNA